MSIGFGFLRSRGSTGGERTILLFLWLSSSELVSRGRRTGVGRVPVTFLCRARSAVLSARSTSESVSVNDIREAVRDRFTLRAGESMPPSWAAVVILDLSLGEQCRELERDVAVALEYVVGLDWAASCGAVVVNLPLLAASAASKRLARDDVRSRGGLGVDCINAGLPWAASVGVETNSPNGGVRIREPVACGLGPRIDGGGSNVCFFILVVAMRTSLRDQTSNN